MRISDWSSDVCSSDLLLVTLGKVALFLALVLIVGTRAAPWILERVARTGSRELFTLSVLATALGIAFGSAALFGVSFALGAFFAGVRSEERRVGKEFVGTGGSRGSPFN